MRSRIARGSGDAATKILDIRYLPYLPSNVAAFSCNRQREAEGRLAAVVSCNGWLGSGGATH
jgi:hypothetical protein